MPVLNTHMGALKDAGLEGGRAGAMKSLSDVIAYTVHIQFASKHLSQRTGVVL